MDHFKSVISTMNGIFTTETNIELPSTIEAHLEEQLINLRPLINENLDDFILLFDIGIHALVELHQAYLELNKSSSSHFSHVVLSAKVCTLLLGIRKLLMAGRVDAIKCLNRSLIETVDLLYVCIQNMEFAAQYGDTKQLYDNKEFYKKNIKDKKLLQHIRKLFNTLEANPKEVKSFFKRREQSQEFLSNSLHGSFNAAFSNFMMYKLDFSDISNDLFGKVTTAYPNIILYLLEEILNLLNVIKLAQEKKLETVPIYRGNSLKKFYHYADLYLYIYEESISKLLEYSNDITIAFQEAPREM